MGKITPAIESKIVALDADGAKYKEMAHAIGRPINTVKTIMYRLREAGLVNRRYDKLDDWSKGPL
jgi:DNA-directed RNA polymerase specialized sigma24 family protein